MSGDNDFINYCKTCELSGRFLCAESKDCNEVFIAGQKSIIDRRCDHCKHYDPSISQNDGDTCKISSEYISSDFYCKYWEDFFKGEAKNDR